VGVTNFSLPNRTQHTEVTRTRPRVIKPPSTKKGYGVGDIRTDLCTSENEQDGDLILVSIGLAWAI